MVSNAVKNIKDDIKTVHSLVDEAIAHGGDLDEICGKNLRFGDFDTKTRKPSKIYIWATKIRLWTLR